MQFLNENTNRLRYDKTNDYSHKQPATATALSLTLLIYLTTLHLTDYQCI